MTGVAADRTAPQLIVGRTDPTVATASRLGSCFEARYDLLFVGDTDVISQGTQEYFDRRDGQLCAEPD